MGLIIESRKEKFSDVWLEKHRPDSLDALVLNDNYKKKFKEFISEDICPSLLFIGPPGTGKTTMAYILIDNLIKDDMDFLELNGSLFRGIDVIKTTILNFIKSMTMASARKIIFIDEADKLTPDAQDSLRNVIEQNSDHVSFIFTANYKYKITDALQSRLQTYTFQKLPKERVVTFVFDILRKENIIFKDDDVNYIINATYPDMRKILNEINKVVYLNDSNQKELALSFADSDFLIEQRFIDSFLTLNANDYSNLKSCYDMIYRDSMDYFSVFEKLHNISGNIKVKTITAKYYNEVAKVVSPKFLMLAFMGEYLELVVRGITCQPKSQ